MSAYFMIEKVRKRNGRLDRNEWNNETIQYKWGWSSAGKSPQSKISHFYFYLQHTSICLSHQWKFPLVLLFYYDALFFPLSISLSLFRPQSFFLPVCFVGFVVVARIEKNSQTRRALWNQENVNKWITVK